MLLARARNQEFLGLRIARETQQLVLFQHAVDGGRELVFVATRLGLDRKRDGGIRQLHLRIDDGRGLVAQRITRQRVPELCHHAQVAGV